MAKLTKTAEQALYRAAWNLSRGNPNPVPQIGHRHSDAAKASLERAGLIALRETLSAEEIRLRWVKAETFARAAVMACEQRSQERLETFAEQLARLRFSLHRWEWTASGQAEVERMSLEIEERERRGKQERREEAPK